MSPERPFSSALPESRTAKKDELPPPRPKKERGIRSDVKKPLEQVRLTTFVHVLICILLVCLGWYTYRTTIFALDAFSPTSTFSAFSNSFSLYTHPAWQFVSKQFHWGVQGLDRHTRLDVKRGIEKLAEALRVGPVDFARAIADAVRQLVPRASLSLLANEAEETITGRAIG